MRAHCVLHPLLVAALLLTGCARTAWEELKPDALPGLAEHPRAQELTLQDETVVLYRTDERSGEAVAEVTHRVRQRYLTPDAERPQQLHLFYNRVFDTVLSFRARVIRPDGTWEELDPSQRMDAPLVSQSLLDDGRRLTLPVPTLPPGSILEVEKRVLRREPRIFSVRQTFGVADPSLVSRLVVTLPEAWEVEWAAQDAGAAFEPSIERGDGRVVLTWEKTNLPPQRCEVGGSRQGLDTFAAVRLKRWQQGGDEQRAPASAREFSAFLYGFVRGVDEADPAIENAVRALVAEAGPDPRARARLIHRYVCEEVDYCSVQLGYGAWTPARASEVLRLRYGDCKGKANLLRTLLMAAGIRSRLLVVWAHGGVPRPYLPALAVANFNHMVLEVFLPEGPVLTDPTAASVPFGELPASLLGAQLLPLEEGGAELIVAPEVGPAPNQAGLALALRLEPDGALRGSFTLRQRGLPAAELREQLLSTSGKHRVDAVRSALGVGAGELTELEWVGLRRGESALEVRGEVELEGATSGSEAVRVLDLSALTRFGLPGMLPQDLERRTPFVLRYAGGETLELSVQLPPGAGTPTVPPTVELEGPSGRYSARYSVEDGALELQRSYLWKRRLTPAAEFQDLRQFVSDVRASPGRVVVPPALPTAGARP